MYPRSQNAPDLILDLAAYLSVVKEKHYKTGNDLRLNSISGNSYRDTLNVGYLTIQSIKKIKILASK